MSVLIEFAIFPTDKGSSVSKDVSEVIKMIRKDYTDYKLTAMGTIVETKSVPEALQIVEKASEILSKHSDRIYASIKLDIRKNNNMRLSKKIASIESKIGEVAK